MNHSEIRIFFIIFFQQFIRFGLRAFSFLQLLVDALRPGSVDLHILRIRIQEAKMLRIIRILNTVYNNLMMIQSWELNGGN